MNQRKFVNKTNTKQKINHLAGERDTLHLHAICFAFIALILMGCMCGSEKVESDTKKDNASPYTDVKAEQNKNPTTQIPSEPSKTDQPDSGSAPSATPDMPPAAAANIAQDNKIEAAPDNASPWTYDTKIDKMEDTKFIFAYNKSINTVNFDFPYSGEQHMTMFVRGQSNKKIDAIMFSLEKGQFLCNSWEGCRATVRLDQDKSFKIKMVEPADHSSNLLFVSNQTSFFKKLKGKKKMMISFDFYNEGSRVFDFNIENLSLDQNP